MTALIILIIALLFGAIATAAYQYSQVRRWQCIADDANSEYDQSRAELEQARHNVVQLQAEAAKQREIAEVQLKLLTQTQQQFEERFRALASEALQNNSQLFLDRSREQFQNIVAPVGDTLRSFEEQVRAMEKSRVGAYEGITAQVQALTQLQERVRQSADQLKTALRSPIQRGRWGELQLRRVVELAGMLEYCDFFEQKTLFGEVNQRPDLIVRLPNK
jgi:DNA recombination protein RmuC